MMRDPGSTSYVGTMGDCRASGEQLRAEAIRRGLALVKIIVFLGDGAAWIWENARLYFPDAIQILDFYHAVEHLGHLTRALYGDGELATARLDVGTPLVFAASDVEDALLAMEDGDGEGAAEIQGIAVESLAKVKDLVAEISVQTGYVAEIVEFLHEAQSDAALLSFRQRQLRENPKAKARAKWRYVRTIKDDVPYCSTTHDSTIGSPAQEQIALGGVCGRRAFLGRLATRAFGIPTRAS